MAAELPSTTPVLTAWVAGGLLAMAGGLTYAEMGSMYPRSGGLYVFLSEGMHRARPSSAALLVILTGSVATVASLRGYQLVSSRRSAPAMCSSLPTPWESRDHQRRQLVAAGSIAIITAINYASVRRGSLTNTILTVAKVGALVAIPLLAVVFLRVDPVFTGGAAIGPPAARIVWRHQRSR